MKTKVWPVSLRVFHWLLAVGFIFAYVLGEKDDLRNLHEAFGLMVGSLIVLRFFYGLFGTEYTRFSAFSIGVKNQVEFFRSFLGKPKTYAGHNPLAALIMLAILIAGLLTALSGFLLYGGENDIVNIGNGEDFLEEAHEVMANLFLGLVILHLAGLLVDLLVHKTHRSVFSMFNGEKNVEGTSYKLNLFQKIYGIVWIVVPILVFLAFLIRAE
ncbi:MAG: cytochrome b/b6 domain-containing protein [Mangrovibacterium sp.]